MADLQLCDGKYIKGRATADGPEKAARSAKSRSSQGAIRWVRAGVWCRGNTMLTTLCMALAMATPLRAQQPATVEAPIDAAAALRSFEEASQWLEDWKTPTDADLPKGCIGAWVGIRLAGRPMGAGSSIDANDLDAPSTRTLPAAVRRAMATAYETAGGVADSDIRADKRESFLASPFRTLEIDFAHSPKRIRATSLDRVLSNIRPGIDGLLMRRGPSSYAVFPAEMLAFDTQPSSAMVSLLSASGADPASFNLEISNGTIRIWSFETLHVAQATRNGAPMFLYRGSRPVPLESINEAEIRRMGRLLAEYLARSTVAPPDDSTYRLLLGDYAPYSDRRLQENASSSEHALAALALLRYSSLASSAGDCAAQARGVAIGLLNMLARSEASRLAVNQDARASALTQLAVKQLRPAELSGDLALLSESSQSGIERAAPVGGKFADELSPEDRALVADALGTAEALNAAWQSVSVELQPLLMPWICDGELALARRGEAMGLVSEMRDLRERILSVQPGRIPGRSAEDDLVGALNYRATQEPDWHAAQLVAFCGLMLGHGACTPPAEQAAEIINLQRSVRFLRQLQVRDVDRYRVRNMDYAMGGLRTGVCDQTMPTAASAMGLLATTSTLESFEHLAGGGQ